MAFRFPGSHVPNVYRPRHRPGCEALHPTRLLESDEPVCAGLDAQGKSAFDNSGGIA